MEKEVEKYLIREGMSVEQGSNPQWTQQTMRIVIDDDSSDEEEDDDEEEAEELHVEPTEDDLLPENESLSDLFIESDTVHFANLPVPLCRALELSTEK